MEVKMLSETKSALGGKNAKFLLLVILLLSGCGPKQFLWQGSYIAINTTEKPKEDFKTNGFIVISYELNKDANVPYKFALVQDNKQAGVIFLENHSEFEALGTSYFLEENGVKRSGSIPFISSSVNHVSYKSYKTLPKYEEVKNDVITILSGQSPEEVFDTTTERSKEDFQTNDYIVIAYELNKKTNTLYKFILVMENEEVGTIVLERHKEKKSGVLETEYLLETDIKGKWHVPCISSHKDSLSSSNHVTYKSYPKCPDYETVKNDVISVLSGTLPK
jgi:hypothetical protein